VVKLTARGHRFVTVTCTELEPGQVDLIYHFDKDLELVNLRLTASIGAGVPSISEVCRPAFLVENEIKDQFGLNFAGLVLDYQGTFYLDEEVKAGPFCKLSVREKSEPEPGDPGEDF